MVKDSQKRLTLNYTGKTLLLDSPREVQPRDRTPIHDVENNRTMGIIMIS